MTEYPPIGKDELIKMLRRWADKELSSDDLCLWAEKRYFPLAVEVGLGEVEITQKSMHVILNELDHADPAQMRRAGVTSALRFLGTDEENFSDYKENFQLKMFGPSKE